MLRTKAEIASLLGIEDWKRRRLCNDHFNELEECGYTKDAKFMNDACILILEKYISEEKQAKEYAKSLKRVVPKSFIAKQLGVTTRTLYTWINGLTGVLGRLITEGYNGSKSHVTMTDYKRIKEHYAITEPLIMKETKHPVNGKKRQNNATAEESQQNNATAEESQQNNATAESEE